MPLNSGTIVGLTKVRDGVAVTYQKQLDELARGIIETFAETHATDATQPALTGVFDYGDGPGMPDIPAPTGLAAAIRIHSRVDPSVSGGSLDRIRDGGINTAPGYEYNTVSTGSDAAFSDRLYSLKDAIGAQRPIDPSLGFGATLSVSKFSTASAGWLQGTRQQASQDVDYRDTLLTHASTALSNATDVNMDDETAMMLQLEKSYSASAKMISTINQMLQTLLNMVG